MRFAQDSSPSTLLRVRMRKRERGAEGCAQDGPLLCQNDERGRGWRVRLREGYCCTGQLYVDPLPPSRADIKFARTGQAGVGPWLTARDDVGCDNVPLPLSHYVTAYASSATPSSWRT